MLKRFVFATFLLSFIVTGLAQKAEPVRLPYHHTRLPSNPLPEGMKKFHLVYKLGGLEKEYMRNDHKRYLDQLGIWGLKRTANEGVKIEIEPDTMSISSYGNSSTIDDKIKYNKVVTFNRALHYTVTLPEQEAKPFIKDSIDDHAYIKHGEWRDSEGEANNWYRNNVGTLKYEYDQEITRKNVNKLSSELSDAIGYTHIEGTVPILRIKKFRKFKYPELDEAIDIAKAAFVLHRANQAYMPEVCKERLTGALEIWETILAKRNMKDIKARINSEIAALAYQNLILVKGLMDDYDGVDQLYARVQKDIDQYAPKGWETYLENWKDYVDYRRKRVESNR